MSDNTETTETTGVTPALEVEDLHLAYTVRGVPRAVLRGVSFRVEPGEAYGLVGESGCGKSTTAYAAMRYMPSNAVIQGGRVLAGGQDVTAMSTEELRQFRAHEASMVYQDPVQAMNPALRIGVQVAECFRILGQSKAEARESAGQALRRVKIADPDRVLDRYPHQLSGGMLQRVVIAMALAGDPKLLVLDEPTTGLDATVEAEVLDLVRELRSETNAAILLIAHNLGVIRTMCDRVGVMYAGRVVEEGTVTGGVRQPEPPVHDGSAEFDPAPRCAKDRPVAVHDPRQPAADRRPTSRRVSTSIVVRSPTTRAVPRFRRSSSAATGTGRAATTPTRSTRSRPPDHENTDFDIGTNTIVQLAAVSKTFRQRGHDVPALVSIDLGFKEGETLGLVGESGSGKSTLAKTLLGIHSADEGGTIELDGRLVKDKATDRRVESIRAFQMVFQNADSALNRMWTVRRILHRSVTKLAGIHGAEADKKVNDLAEAMRLSQRHLEMKPRQLSGGLKQRVAIARAFAGDPRIVVCDEPTSALDVSVQAAILNLLANLQNDERTSYLFITHDIGVVRYLSDRIAVMYLGRIMELGTTEQIFAGPEPSLHRGAAVRGAEHRR